VSRYVSDAIVDLLQQLGVKYLPLNPGASFRGLHDSVVNRDGGPEIILCTHEEIGVAAAHAYAKAVGEVGFAVVHDLVGLMHASMAVYDAWCDRTPLVVLGGGGPADPAKRRPVDWYHSANTQSELVRPFVKWDDDPITAEATVEAIARAYNIAGSAPGGPTYVTLDSAVMESEYPATDETLPPTRHNPPFVAAESDIEAAAVLLSNARFPVVVAGNVGLDQRSTPLLLELMETLGAAGRDERNLSALPVSHPLCFNGDDWVLDQADVILAVDVHDIRYLLARTTTTPTVIDLSTRSLTLRSWANVDHVGAQTVTSLVSDPLLGLAALNRAVADRSDESGTRAERLEILGSRREELEQDRKRRREFEWNGQPVSVSRMVAEVYRAVEDLPWLLTLRNTRSWPEGVWQFDRAGRYLGHSGGGGLGYGPGALIGGGLAARDRGEFPVGIIGDGDLMYAPGAIWTAAHHRIPMLVVVNNNRTYLNDEEHQEHVAKVRGRPVENAPIGIAMDDPAIDFAALARSQGAWGHGPVTDPDELAHVLKQAVEQVHDGAVAVVDVHTAK
jgi:thiamine pyrophosphate-dependent acetolactate synthase large subunit-like protein